MSALGNTEDSKGCRSGYRDGHGCTLLLYLLVDGSCTVPRELGNTSSFGRKGRVERGVPEGRYKSKAPVASPRVATSQGGSPGESCTTQQRGLAFCRSMRVSACSFTHLRPIEPSPGKSRDVGGDESAAMHFTDSGLSIHGTYESLPGPWSHNATCSRCAASGVGRRHMRLGVVQTAGAPSSASKAASLLQDPSFRPPRQVCSASSTTPTSVIRSLTATSTIGGSSLALQYHTLVHIFSSLTTARQDRTRCSSSASSAPPSLARL